MAVGAKLYTKVYELVVFYQNHWRLANETSSHAAEQEV
jgi:hypothetical protein